VGVVQRIRFLVLILISSCLIFLGFTFCLEKMLSKDISLEPISSIGNPDFQAKDFSPRASVHLVSYADGPEVFFKNQNVLAASAVNKGFDFILNYRRSHLDPTFVKENIAILSQKKGAGFWLWKPWLILKTLETVPENDIVVYMDSGVLFRNPIKPLVDLANEHEIILFEYDPDEYWGKPVNITKREIFLALECDTEKCHKGRHVWSGAAIFKNTPKSRALVKEWLTYCLDEKLLTDELDAAIQHPEFKRQYHDEAILNTLYNKDPEDKYLFPSKIFFEEYATWHHRHPEKEYYSLLMANHNNRSSLIYKTQSELINNYITLLLRRLFSSTDSSNTSVNASVKNQS